MYVRTVAALVVAASLAVAACATSNEPADLADGLEAIAEAVEEVEEAAAVADNNAAPVAQCDPQPFDPGTTQDYTIAAGDYSGDLRGLLTIQVPEGYLEGNRSYYAWLPTEEVNTSGEPTPMITGFAYERDNWTAGELNDLADHESELRASTAAEYDDFTVGVDEYFTLDGRDAHLLVFYRAPLRASRDMLTFDGDPLIYTADIEVLSGTSEGLLMSYDFAVSALCAEQRDFMVDFVIATVRAAEFK